MSLDVHETGIASAGIQTLNKIITLHQATHDWRHAAGHNTIRSSAPA